MTKKKKVDNEIEELESSTTINDNDAVVEEEEVVLDENNQMFTPGDEYDDDFVEDEGILTGEQYDVPEDVDGFVDADTGEILKREDMTPWQIIKAIAKQNNVQIRNPAKGCNHCYEKGYEGLDHSTKMPVPCRCLFRGKTEKEKQVEAYYDASKMTKKISREQKRKMSKFIKSAFRKERREQAKRIKAGIPIHTENDGGEEIEIPAVEVNKILKEYIKQDSLKKTASSLNCTLTKVKKVIKTNRTKLEKLRTKGTK